MKGLNTVVMVQGNNQVLQYSRVYSLKATITSKPEGIRGGKVYWALEGKKGLPSEEHCPLTQQVRGGLSGRELGKNMLSSFSFLPSVYKELKGGEWVQRPSNDIQPRSKLT